MDEDNKIFADAFNIVNPEEPTAELPKQTIVTATTGKSGIPSETFLAMQTGMDLIKLAESPVIKMLKDGTMYDYGKLPGPEQNMTYLHKMAALKKVKLKTKRTLARNMQFLGAFLGDANFLAIAKENRDTIETDEVKVAKGDLAIDILSNQDKYSEQEIWQARRNAMSDYKDLYGADTAGKNTTAIYQQASADSAMYMGYNYMFPAISNAMGLNGSGSTIQISADDVAFQQKVIDMSEKGELTFDIANKMADQFDGNEAMKKFIYKYVNSDKTSTDKTALIYQAFKDNNIDMSPEQMDAFIKQLGNVTTTDKPTY